MLPNLASDRPALVLLFRLLHQIVAQEIDRDLRQAGFADIRLAHSNVFPFVPEHGIQVVELAALAGVRKQSMAQSVEQMEASGYIYRESDPNDGRAQLVFLTERGKTVRPIAIAAGRRVEQRWAALIGEDELEDLRGRLKHLLEVVRSAEKQD